MAVPVSMGPMWCEGFLFRDAWLLSDQRTIPRHFFSFSSPAPHPPTPKSRYEALMRDMPVVNSVPHRHGSEDPHTIPEGTPWVPLTVWNWFHTALR